MRRALSLSAAALVMLVSAKASANYHPSGRRGLRRLRRGSERELHPAPDVRGGPELRQRPRRPRLRRRGRRDRGGLVTFSADVANGSDQANILIGTSTVTSAFGVVPDFTLPANLLQAGGAVCFDATALGLIDCFSWGNFAPGAAADGAVVPFNALTADKAARRSISSSDATLLEATDDSNNVFDDFDAVDPAPKNNPAPCPTAAPRRRTRARTARRRPARTRASARSRRRTTRPSRTRARRPIRARLPRATTPAAASRHSPRAVVGRRRSACSPRPRCS